VRLDELDFKDVRVECIFGTRDENAAFRAQRHHELTALGLNEHGEAVYALKLTPGFSGLQYYKIRVYPYHPLLRHPLEVGLMLWI
jgi:starch phosphorylase